MKSFNIMKSFILFFIFAFIFVVGFNALPAQAQNLSENLGMEYAGNLDLPASENDDVRDTAVVIIKYLITFIGIIAVVIILYGGFVWMTAGGNDDRVGKAKKIIISGAIGLVIIIAAFAIVTFVINMTEQAMQGDL